MKNLKNFADFVNEEFGEIDREHEYEPRGENVHSGRYLDLEILPNGLWIHLNEGGKKENEEEDNLSQDRFWDYFEDIEVNSDWKYIDDMGEAGFGLTSAPGITQGYYIDDNGKLTDDDAGSSNVYYYDNYMITDFTDKLKEEGKVFFHKA